MTPKEKKKLEEAFRAARLRAVKEAPYLATALWNLIPICRPEIPTMAVDKYWRVYYNPDALEHWGVEATATVLIHEVWHMLYDHAGRGDAMGINKGTALLWNVAADYEINDNLERAGLTFPIDESGNTIGVFPHQNGLPNGKMAEWYYEEIIKNAKVVKGIAAAAGNAGPMDGNDGSGATGVTEEWEDEGSPSGGGEGDDDEGNSKPNSVPSVGEAEADVIRRQVAEDIQQKGIGNVPGNAARWAETQINPKVDWRSVLRGAVKSALMWSTGMVDYTYNRPSRRQSAFPRFVLPSMRAPLPKVAVCIDTSGSMYKEDLETALSETKGILDALQSAVTVFSVDTKVHTHQNVFSADQIELVGGGGTDMGEALIAAADINPSVAIVITDGYTPWPAHKPKGIGKVVICITRRRYGYGSVSDTPKWARTIVVDDDEH